MGMNKAVIMAGGFGTRLRPLTMTIPKPMVSVLNVPMVEHIINLLKKHNINDLITLLYFQPESISSYFEDGAKWDVSMNYVLAQADYGTAGAVKNAYKYLDERFIIISGDVLTDFDLTAALNFHVEKKSKATLLLTRVTAPLQYGIVMTDKDGKITRFLEKPSWGQVFSDTINTGIYILEPEVLDLIPYQQEFDFSKDLFPLMLQKDMPLYGYIAEGYWKDVGNLDEYQLAQFDALYGKVQLHNNQLVNNISIGENPNLAQSTVFKGYNVIGNNVTIGENCEIKDCSIGNNVTIGNGSKLQGCMLWDGVSIGDFSELYDDVICFDVKIGDFVNIQENVFIADSCIIGSHTRLYSNIKLWPKKYVEEGSTLSRSLVQEEKWQRELFTDARISGISNIEINPEFGAKLGSALGLTLGKGTSVLASRDPDPVSRLMKRAITAGLLSVGVNVNDLQTISIPQTRQELRMERHAGGFHIRKSLRDPGLIDIIIFSKDGRDISINDTKKIERYFFGEDIKRVLPGDVGILTFPERTNEIYRNRFLSSLDVEMIFKRNFKLLVDYSFGLASTILPGLLGKLNTEVISLNNFVDGTRFHPDPDMEDGSDNTGRIMKSLGYELGFRLQPGAEKVSVIDERGIWYSNTRLSTIVTKLYLETHRHLEPYKIAISVVAPSEIDEVAKDYNVEVVRIKNSHSAMMDATLDTDVKYVTGIYGGFIFSDFLFASDGMFTIGQMLEMLAKTGYTLSYLDETLPKRYQCVQEIPVAWDYKGTVMRKAMDYSENYDRQLVEGVKIFDRGDSVLLLPSKEKGAFQVFAESDTLEDATRNAAKFIELIKSWKR
ncbi:MAG TPA: sugar phosphate nucleotidyltransferase [Candidatus Kapabacteria bacterium]|nr:sugar phosphate nucleotidyltransferase [Candidatus Kapabacteria bacterium]